MEKLIVIILLFISALCFIIASWSNLKALDQKYTKRERINLSILIFLIFIAISLMIWFLV
jgi:hypothetical protein